MPAWYLSSGTKNATENELEGASSSFERWSQWCGAIVIVAVIAEIVIAIVEPPYPLFLKFSLPTDVGVALGIVGEVIFAMFDNRIQTELRRRSNEKLGLAEKEAAEAKLEAEKLKSQFAWRQISPMQEQILRHALSVLKSSSVHIWAFMHDVETQNFALDLRAIFWLSGWRVSLTFGSYTGNFPYGLITPIGSGETKLMSETIRIAFENASIESMPLSIPLPSMSGGADGNNAERPWAEIYVGPKFPIFSTPLIASEIKPSTAETVGESSI